MRLYSTSFMLGKPSVICKARFARPYESECLPGFCGLSLEGDEFRLFLAECDTPISLTSLDGSKSAFPVDCGCYLSLIKLFNGVAGSLAGVDLCGYWPAPLQFPGSYCYRTELRSRFVISKDDPWVFLQLIGGALTRPMADFCEPWIPMFSLDFCFFRSADLLNSIVFLLGDLELDLWESMLFWLL